MRHEAPAVYQIQIEGCLRPAWSQWLGAGMIALTPGPEGSGRTIITAAVADQAALRGVLNKLWDLNLTLISVQRAARERIGGNDGDELDSGPGGCARNIGDGRR